MPKKRKLLESGAGKIRQKSREYKDDEVSNEGII
jgi:hypothetical protein